MIYNELGNTGINVSKICFGGLTVGPLQANFSVQKGSKIILKAFEMGINFIDTAQIYKTYGHIREALKSYERDKIVISTKSYAYSKGTAEESLSEALRELDTDYIDLFMLHEQESIHTLRGHYEALEYYQKMKEKGYIKAIGMSTHHIAAVKAALNYGEIQVVHPILNKAGIGIQDGNIDEMIDVLKIFKSTGKDRAGIFAMKPLGGGHLIKKYDEAFDFVNSLDIVDSFAIGMQSEEEVIANVYKLENKELPDNIKKNLSKKERKIIIDPWCEGCGTCVKACNSGALSISPKGKAIVDMRKCIFCGYCSKECPNFYIKVI